MNAQHAALRLALVDDAEIVAAGLVSMLSAHHDRIAVQAVPRRSPIPDDADVVLYDVAEHSFKALLSRADPRQMKVLVFTWQLDHPEVARAIARGALGCLHKSASPGEILAALEHACVGQRAPVGASSHISVALSPREAEILGLIVQGLSNQEIADQCFLSINSVKTYVRIAYRKIGVERRAQAVAWGMSHGYESNPVHTETVDIAEATESRV